ncbi:pyruvate kinase [Patescibacteria group bacterium]
MPTLLPQRTKIVCTIGPAVKTKTKLNELMQAGMDMARLNFSHGTHAEHKRFLKILRDLAKERKQPIAILQDLQGPKIRVGDLPEGGVQLKNNEEVIFTVNKKDSYAKTKKIPVDYAALAKDVKKGDAILLNDGLFETKVVSVTGDDIKVKVIEGGKLTSHKGVNVPTANLTVKALTAKDKKDLLFGLKNDVDYIGLSFVRTPQDVKDLRKLIDKHKPTNTIAPKIIAKIERAEALKNIDTIIEEVDGVMVARGDLGVETSLAEVPLHQKMIIRKARLAHKPVIVATQMLASMEDHPRPTRAEVSDVANAVIDHADATMLSGESATGKYPIKTVQTMANIIKQTEDSPFDNLETIASTRVLHESASLAVLATQLTKTEDIAAIVVATQSGFSARAIASNRPELPIIALTPHQRIANQLQLSWGVYPVVIDFIGSKRRLLDHLLKEIRTRKLVVPGRKVVLVGGLDEPLGDWQKIIRIEQI